MNTKKTISPVVATALLIVVAVVAVVGFQGWFSDFSSKLFTNTETQSNGGSLSTKIETIKDGTLYFNNQFSENVTIQEIKIGNTSCSNVSGAYETGVNEINVRNCLGDITEEVAKDVVVVTNKGVYQKKEFLDLFTNYCTLDGVSLRTGENYTFYSAQIALDCSVLTQTRFCDNGELNGSSIYAYSACDLSTFRSVWNTSKNTSSGSSPATNIVLPLEATGTYNFIASWGDGTNSTITAYNDVDNNHTYASAGVYQINITGTITGFRFNNGGDKLKLTEIKEFGPLRLGNSASYFYGASNMIITATDVLNMSGTTTMASAFRGASSLTTVPSMNEWNMSQVTTMSAMFFLATNFNQNISSWDVRNVTDMSYMFYDTNFNNNIGTWNTSNVVSMEGLFYNTDFFNQNISGWNTIKVTTMRYLFLYSTNFNQPLDSWDVRNVTDMSYMFNGATSFNQSLNNWNTVKVTNMDLMFSGATNFNGNISSWDVRNVTTMGQMFYGTTKFNQDLNQWNTTSLTNLDGIFYNAAIFNGNISNWNVGKVTNIKELVRQAPYFNQSLATWDVRNVTNMDQVFQGATRFNQNISSWNVSQALYMRWMFDGATNFNQDLSSWDVDQVVACGSFNHSTTTWTQPKPTFTSCTP